MSAAPMKPALGPSAACTISGSVRWPRPVSDRENAVRVGPISSSPASDSPPPMMMQPGSNAAAMPASPTPSQRPTSASSSIDSGSPSRAAWVICGPSSRVGVAVDELAQVVGHRRVGADQLAGVADQGVARGVLLPAAAVAALAPVAVGHDLHVAELAGHPVGAAVDPVVEDERAADAGAERRAEHEAVAAPGAEPALGQAPRCWRRCRRPRAAAPARRPARAAARGASQVRREHHDGAGHVDEARPRRCRPPPRRTPGRSRWTRSTMVSSTARTSWPSVGRRSTRHHVAGRVDDRAEHLGAADVDPDRQRLPARGRGLAAGTRPRTCGSGLADRRAGAACGPACRCR